MKNWKLVLILGIAIAVLVAMPHTPIIAGDNQSQTAITIHCFGKILPHS